MYMGDERDNIMYGVRGGSTMYGTWRDSIMYVRW